MVTQEMIGLRACFIYSFFRLILMYKHFCQCLEELDNVAYGISISFFFFHVSTYFSKLSSIVYDSNIRILLKHVR